MNARSLRTIVALVLLAVTEHLAAAEEWFEAYERGVAAVKAGQYKEAVPALQRSLARRHTESAAVRVEDRTLVYLPHFWLGVARHHLGDLDEAVREWKISEEQGAIQQTASYADLRERLASVQGKKPAPAAAPATGETRQTASAAVRAAASAQVAALAAGGDKVDPYPAGSRKLQEALDAVADGGSDPRHYRRAVQLAGEARGLFAKAEAEAKKRKASSPAPQKKPAVAEEFSVPFGDDAPNSAAPAAPAAAPQEAAPVISAEQAEVTVELQRYRGRLTAARDAKGADTAFRDYLKRQTAATDRWQKQLRARTGEATIREISRQIEEKERELEGRIAKLAAPAPVRASVVPSAPPATDTAPVAPAPVASHRGLEIESAYRSLGRGDVDLAEQQLTAMIERSPSADAYLLRGCVRYTKGMLSASPQALLDGASADFEAALALDAAARLDPAAFSPKLIAFFERVRSSLP